MTVTTKMKVGAIALLAAFMLVSLTFLKSKSPQDSDADSLDADAIPSQGRVFTRERPLMFVNVRSPDPAAKRKDLVRCAGYLRFSPIFGDRVAIARLLNDQISVIRFRFDPNQLRAHNLSIEQIVMQIEHTRIINRGDWIEEFIWEVFTLEDQDLISVVVSSHLEQFDDIHLGVNADDVFLKLKDIGRVELVSTLFDISSEVDERPAASLLLKGAPDTDFRTEIEKVKAKTENLRDNRYYIAASKRESWPEIKFEFIPFNKQSMIYAVIETPLGSTLEHTRLKCHELGAIAKRIDGIASITSLAGYQIRTQSGGANEGTCLIHLKDRPDRKLTSVQIKNTLAEKCRGIDAHVEFFEPPGVFAYYAAGGFSVRVLDQTNSNIDELGEGTPKPSMDNLLNRPDLSQLFDFLVSDYPQYELVIDNDVARRKGVSIAHALEKLAAVVSDEVQPVQKFQRLTEGLSRLSVNSDRAGMVPYRSFMRLKDKLKLNGVEPLKPMFP